MMAVAREDQRAREVDEKRAAFLSARNDALANVAIIGAGLVTAWTLSL
jgi:Co/Zn/Cd efflux system component